MAHLLEYLSNLSSVPLKASALVSGQRYPSDLLKSLYSVIFKAFLATKSKYLAMQDGVNLSYTYLMQHRGNISDNKTVVFVHGFAAEKTEKNLFIEIIPYIIKNNYNVLLYDWRGLGKSEGNFEEISLEQHVNDFMHIVEWIESQNTRVEAIGFSLGATVIALALQKGLKISKAVFLSPAMRPSISIWPRYNTPEVWDAIATNGFIYKPDNRVKLGKNILCSLRDTDLGDKSFQLDIPLMVCHGIEDTRIPINITRTIASNGGCIAYHEIPGASHSFRPEVTCRPELYAILERWFQKDVSESTT